MVEIVVESDPNTLEAMSTLTQAEQRTTNYTRFMSFLEALAAQGYPLEVTAAGDELRICGDGLGSLGEGILEGVKQS
jgi:hypothetical protein